MDETFGKITLTVSSGLLGVYALLMLIGGIMTGLEITSAYIKAYYIILPAMLLVGAALCIVLQNRFIDQQGNDDRKTPAVFNCLIAQPVFLNVLFAYSVPEWLAPVYTNVKSFSKIDIPALFNGNGVFITTLVLTGIFFFCKMGFYLLHEERPMPYLVSNAISKTAFFLIYLPILNSKYDFIVKLGAKNLHNAYLAIPFVIYFTFWGVTLCRRTEEKLPGDADSALTPILRYVANAVAFPIFVGLLCILSGLFNRPLIFIWNILANNPVSFLIALPVVCFFILIETEVARSTQAELDAAKEAKEASEMRANEMRSVGSGSDTHYYKDNYGNTYTVDKNTGRKTKH
jgi:hypothetical protein